MAPWLIVWFVVALATVVLLAAFAIALVRHGLVLGRAAKELAQQAGPIARQISRESDRASARAANLPSPRAGGRRGRRG